MYATDQSLLQHSTGESKEMQPSLCCKLMTSFQLKLSHLYGAQKLVFNDDIGGAFLKSYIVTAFCKYLEFMLADKFNKDSSHTISS